VRKALASLGGGPRGGRPSREPGRSSRERPHHRGRLVLGSTPIQAGASPLRPAIPRAPNSLRRLWQVHSSIYSRCGTFFAAEHGKAERWIRAALSECLYALAIPRDVTPVQHRPRRDVDTAFGEKLGHLSGREWVADIPPHRGEDHVGRPAIAGEDRGGGGDEVASAGAAGVALAGAVGPDHRAWWGFVGRRGS
jgi:hypothetical protein